MWAINKTYRNALKGSFPEGMGENIALKDIPLLVIFTLVFMSSYGAYVVYVDS
ncbi:hypothetical protein M422DRAFT_35794 [Sphaerobolus stellatus SS14]|uniref:Uncharacterized protein n=1 Tax=Sphaerobolus stellatus (strain SS14) TaxID=990650 RepID=A0A0C9V4U0_SPHS4|nr:hypothetical protein M422DRAFT_35794 [Sphaerobolus stellatus SS14]